MSESRACAPDVLVVGAGFAGMYAVYRLRELGLSVLVLEAGSDVGGTWYWNRYPGARCDVPSLEYSYGFSRELEQEWDWPEVFSAQPDILRYANHVADCFALREHMRFHTRVVRAQFLEAPARWRLTSEVGDTYEAPFLIMATGCLSVPMTPDLPGVGSFAGPELHTGRWPHEPVDLAGKRIGIIGTGSSGVQAIPELAQQAAQLTVLQRSAVYTVPANRKAMRAAVQSEFREHYGDIRRLQQANFGGVSNYRPRRRSEDRERPARPVRGKGRDILDLTPIERRRVIAEQGLEALLTFRDVYLNLEANEAANELFRETVRELVHDPEVAARLLPRDYGLGCKRQVLDRDYYATFNRDNVRLVDVNEDPIERIEPGGVRTRSGLIELDALIYATGFDAMTGALLGANISGRDGLPLATKWRDGPVNFLGLAIGGFPNLFTVTGPGSPSVLCNMLVAIEQHVNWIADAIVYLREHGMASMEAQPEAEQAWVAHVNEVAEGTMYTAPSCNSWYLGANVPGKPRVFLPYVGGYPRYKDRCDQVAAQGYSGFALTAAGSGAQG